MDPILDTHHHFWRVARGDYHWMTPDLKVLCRDYMPDDLAQSLRQAGVTKTIVVQAAATEAETEFLLSIAETTDCVAGVCGWLDMERDDFPQRLDRFAANPWFKSFRPMLQDLDEPDWILKPRILDNLALAAHRGVRFEFLTKPRELPHAIEALRRTPGLKAVINHISKPDIAAGAWEPWANQIAEAGTFQNVYCKLSGMVTEADHRSWTPANLEPYIAHVLEVFGSERVMYGSDWPVALLAAESYASALNALRTVVGPLLDARGHKNLFHDTGKAFYAI